MRGGEGTVYSEVRNLNLNYLYRRDVGCCKIAPAFFNVYAQKIDVQGKKIVLADVMI